MRCFGLFVALRALYGGIAHASPAAANGGYPYPYPQCSPDACLSEVQHNQWGARSSCTAFLCTTVTEAWHTATVTETTRCGATVTKTIGGGRKVTSTVTNTQTASTTLTVTVSTSAAATTFAVTTFAPRKRGIEQQPSMPPGAPSCCHNAAAYASACSCAGVRAHTTTVAVTTATRTVTATETGLHHTVTVTISEAPSYGAPSTVTVTKQRTSTETTTTTVTACPPVQTPENFAIAVYGRSSSSTYNGQELAYSPDNKGTAVNNGQDILGSPYGLYPNGTLYYNPNDGNLGGPQAGIKDTPAGALQLLSFEGPSDQNASFAQVACELVGGQNEQINATCQPFLHCSATLAGEQNFFMCDNSLYVASDRASSEPNCELVDLSIQQVSQQH